MNQTILLQKLIAIERAIGVASNNTLRDLVYQAESHLLQMQRDEAQALPMLQKNGTGQRFQFLREIAESGSSKSGF